MYRVLFILILLPTLAKTQGLNTATKQIASPGIQWTSGLTWEQIKARAHTENKYIFLDCFATWCLPCKLMDRNVYSNDTVGQYMKDIFISVKVQFDRTDDDNEQIKTWYADAQAIQEAYQLKGYPSFLFFAPDGNLMHRGIGYNNVEGFIKLAASALDTTRKELYIKLREYKNGNKDYTIMPDLSKAATELLGDKDLSSAISKDYKNNYLDNLDDKALFTKENLHFISDNTNLLTSKDKLFWAIYKQPLKTDTLINSAGFSSRLINYIIAKEEIEEKIWKGNRPVTENPNWNRIKALISKKYNGNYAETLLPGAQLGFYLQIKNWKEYIKYIEISIKKYSPKKDSTSFSVAVRDIPGSPDSWALNTIAWNLFLGCKDKKLLKKALNWSELSLQLGADQGTIFQYYDTKANLLYKLAKLYRSENIEEAIKLEERAIQLVNYKENEISKHIIRGYRSIIQKMKNGEPTWPLKDQKQN